MDTLARLMAPDPQFIDPWLLAEQRERLDGELEVSAMQRLGELLAKNAGQIHYRLEFGKDTDGTVYIRGGFQVQLQVYCQRCLNPIAVSLDREICVGVVATRAQADVLPTHYDPLLLSNGHLSLLSFIEDEVLLGMPMAPVHEQAECPSSGMLERLRPARETPFSVLKGLKLRNSNG